MSEATKDAAKQLNQLQAWRSQLLGLGLMPPDVQAILKAVEIYETLDERVSAKTAEEAALDKRLPEKKKREAALDAAIAERGAELDRINTVLADARKRFSQ